MVNPKYIAYEYMYMFLDRMVEWMSKVSRDEI
jgi:hypothetical protein